MARAAPKPNAPIDLRVVPALLGAALVATGIVLAAKAGLSLEVWMGLAAAGLAAFIAAQRRARRLVSLRALARTAAVALVLLALGGARYVQFTHAPPGHVARVVETLDGQTVTLIGRVVSAVEASPARVRFDVETRHLLAPGALATHGRARVTLSPPRQGDALPYPPIARGDLLRLEGLVRALPKRRNPADMDYGAYLARRGVAAQLRLYEPSHVAILGSEASVVDRFMTTARSYVEESLARFVPTAEGRAVLAALVLGDRSRLETTTRNHFARTGLMHLLAVSGLHVLLVGLVFYGLLRPFLLRLGFRRRRPIELVRSALTMGLLVGYMLLAGSSASVVRAVVMAGLFMGSSIVERTTHPLNALGAAGLALLLVRPTQLFDVGFQLSFAAVAALVVFGRAFEAARYRWRARRLAGPVAASAFTSAAATLGTMPVLLVHFGRVAFGGLALNLAAIPCTALTLSGALATLACGAWAPGLATLFGHGADLFARLLLALAGTGDHLVGHLAWEAHLESAWFVLALVAALAALALWQRPRLRWRMTAAALALTAAGVWAGVAAGAHAARLEVVFFDVGQGDAALVVFPRGRTLLVDTGVRDEHTDQGARTLLPHLQRYGIERLDAVVVTHPHSDHLGGLPALLRAVPVGRVVHNGQIYGSDLFAEARHLADSLEVPWQPVHAGDTLDLDDHVQVDVLAPFPEAVHADANNASVVLRLAYGTTSLLFTGDAEAAAEARLLETYGEALRSDVVKVGHHGSATSSTPAFVRQSAAEAAWAVVSVAERNRYGLPSPNVLERWRRIGTRLRLTSETGALWLRSDGVSVAEVEWR